jgi:hypothetical protein
LSSISQPHRLPISSRREFLLRGGSGLSALALASLLPQNGMAAEGRKGDLLAPRPPHYAPKAKSVIWLFMEGGPSHIDLFDPKPELEKLAGKPMPPSFGRVITAMGTGNNAIMPSQRQWKRHGQSGQWVSDWYPHIARHMDDIAVLRSCQADGLNHVGSVCQMNTGSILAGRPSMGSWVTYGLGAANRDLPTFVILCDDKEVIGGPNNWSSGFLPATYQGTQFRTEGPPILDVRPPETIGEEQQRGKLDLLKSLNQRFGIGKEDDTNLEARIQSYELAYRMQSAAPEAVDLTKETAATRKMYGMDEEITHNFGRNCLLARRLVERGVRFVELYCSSGSGWDAHNDMEDNHTRNCKISDQPIAALMADLKARGLLDDTLVVWGGEFGRTPFNEKGLGRDHNPWGFTMWFAGGGIKPGQTVGSTDEIGLRAVERPAHVHDIHATILHLLGLNHLDLTFLHNGRAERPTIVAGEVIQELLS